MAWDNGRRLYVDNKGFATPGPDRSAFEIDRYAPLVLVGLLDG